MTDCVCIRDNPHETNLRINLLAEDLALSIVAIIVEEGFCHVPGELVMGRVMAEMSIRLAILEMGDEAARKLQGTNMVELPATRKTMERIVAHARNLTEGENLARN